MSGRPIISSVIINCLLLSLFSAELRTQPLSEDRCAEIPLNHLRALQTIISISYIRDASQLADAETKHTGSLNILSKFMISGQFNVSFVGRGQMNAMRIN